MSNTDSIYLVVALVALATTLAVLAWVIALRWAVQARTTAIVESEQKFATAFQSSPDAILITRVIDGGFVEVNDAFCELSGISRDKIAKCTTDDLNWMPTEDVDRLLAAIARDGFVRDFGVRILNKSNQQRDVVLSSDPIIVNGEQCLLCVIRDVTERLQALRALEASERKFQTLFSLSPVGMGISRVSDGKLIDVNAGYAELLRLPRAEIIGKTAVELKMYPSTETRDSLLAELRKKGKLQNIILTNHRPDGSRYVNLTSAALIELDEEDCIVGATIDITQRVEAEQALAASQRQFEALFELSPIGMLLSRLQDGKIILINRAYEGMMGYRREDVVGKTSIELGIVDETTRSQCVARLMQVGSIRDVEFEVKKKDGHTAIHSTSLEVIESNGEQLVFSCAVDVTARRQMEEQLAKSERKFQALFQLNPAALAFAHAKSGTFVELNQAFEEVHGVSRVDAIGKTAVEVGIYPNEEVRNQFVQQLLKHGRIRGAELTQTRADGARVTISGNAELLELDGEQFLISASLDITALKSAEEKLKTINASLERLVAEQTEELQAANKELEAFCYSVSHDLRAPLRSIDGFSQALHEDYAGTFDEQAKDFLMRIRGAARRMSELIDDLLELSRVTRAEIRRTDVNLSRMAREIASGLQNASPDRIAQFTIAEDIVVQGDRNLLRVLLDNLLGNAWKYTSKTQEAKIEFGKGEFEGKEFLFVRDNGAGFDAQYIHKLFQPFQRLHRPDEFPGHGIGLATVKRIVNRHGGQVRAEGEVDQGATFWFTLESGNPMEIHP